MKSQVIKGAVTGGAWDRMAPLGGVGFIVLVLISLVLQRDRPAIGDPAADVGAFFSDHRSEILAATFLLALGLVVLLWLLGSLVEGMRDVGERRLATTALAGFLLTFSVGAVAALVRAALAFSVAGNIAPSELRAINDVTQVTDVMSSTFFAAFAVAVAAATLRTGFLPRYWGWASGVIGAIAIIGGTAWPGTAFGRQPARSAGSTTSPSSPTSWGRASSFTSEWRRYPSTQVRAASARRRTR